MVFTSLFNRRDLCAVASALLLATVTPIGALAAGDALIDGARQCTQHFPIEEKKNNIPTHLLAAIATTESGRYHKGLGMSVPWPWTINVDGKGYYFNSKAEAIAQTQNLIASGRQSIDVGCMQVNLKHHPKAFANLSQAFEPATNVAYAAKFLRDNYAGLGDWIKATAAYHSRTAVHGKRYLVEIERSWNSIVGKVAQARVSKAGGTVMASNTNTRASSTGVTERAPRIINTTKPMKDSRHVRVIRVDDSLRQRSEVMVVKPTPPVTALAPVASSQPVEVADASATPVSAVSTPTNNAPVLGNSIRRVNLDTPSDSALPAAKPTGPKFVFAN